MGAALALAVMLVVVVAVLSMAVNAQGPFQATGAGAPGTRSGRAQHPGHQGGATDVGATERGQSQDQRRGPKEQRRGPRERVERLRDRRGAPPPAPVPDPAAEPGPLEPIADLKPLGSEASATVISVVDERTVGPVTRSRLTLRVEPIGSAAFEVTTRVAFPTPEDRARLKVGATLPVRYDADDHRRVVVDMDKGPLA